MPVLVYSLGGTRLNGIQSGYARPALAAGKTRFVLYNRSGNELRVESRTQNLYSKTLENSIYLCAMSDTGTLAVATDSADSTARLTVYTPTMSEQLHWDMTGTAGHPGADGLCRRQPPSGGGGGHRQCGAATGKPLCAQPCAGRPGAAEQRGSVPQWLGWLNDDTRAGCVREPRRAIRCRRRRAWTL